MIQFASVQVGRTLTQRTLGTRARRRHNTRRATLRSCPTYILWVAGQVGRAPVPDIPIGARKPSGNAPLLPDLHYTLWVARKPSGNAAIMADLS